MKSVNVLRRLNAAANRLTLRGEAFRIALRIADAETCPLGIMQPAQHSRDLDAVDTFPAVLKRKCIAAMTQQMDLYHRPVVKGRNGHRYSRYEMDRAMMGY